jgi:hypothetical protein
MQSGFQRREFIDQASSVGMGVHCGPEVVLVIQRIAECAGSKFRIIHRAKDSEVIVYYI